MFDNAFTNKEESYYSIELFKLDSVIISNFYSSNNFN